jgi:hypothetical protein
MPESAEPGGEALDLAQEVVGGEAILPQPVRQRVGRGGERDAPLRQPRQQA